MLPILIPDIDDNDTDTRHRWYQLREARRHFFLDTLRGCESPREPVSASIIFFSNTIGALPRTFRKSTACGCKGPALVKLWHTLLSTIRNQTVRLTRLMALFRWHYCEGTHEMHSKASYQAYQTSYRERICATSRMTICEGKEHPQHTSTEDPECITGPSETGVHSRTSRVRVDAADVLCRLDTDTPQAPSGTRVQLSHGLRRFPPQIIH